MSSPQFLSAEAMNAYCNLFRIENSEDIETLARMLTILDNHKMEDWAKKDKARQAASKSKSGKKF